MASENAQPTPRYLGTNEAAHLLGLQAQTLRRWRTKGGGPPFLRLGDGPAARCVYPLAALEGWVAEHTFRSNAEAFAKGRPDDARA
jgi:Helix-turn-helix domain